MARVSILAVVLLVFCCKIGCSRGNIAALSAIPGNDRALNLSGAYVCHPEWFKKLGLEIKEFGFCYKSLSYGVRAKDLIDRMTLEEKVQQLVDNATGVPRLGLPTYGWWSEALHGVVASWRGRETFFTPEVPGATSFLTPITTAATFNRTLWKAIEARAMSNLGNGGLTYWSPNINIVRDPRWGRALETPGEDPFVVGTYGVSYVRGLQDVEEDEEEVKDLNARPLKVAACCKHYSAYDLDNWFHDKYNQIDRFHFDERVREQDMIETFLKPFEMCVKDGDVASIMCSYNQVNGFPSCVDANTLKGTIRGEWYVHGYIVSYCTAIESLVEKQKWLNVEPEDAVAQALKAGLDLSCGYFYRKFGANAVVEGKVREADIDNALKNLYIMLFRLGFFDGNPKLQHLGKIDVCSKENVNLALQAAREGMGLLQNINQTLPLDHTVIQSVAIVGPHANATDVMLGNYKGIPCRLISPVVAFEEWVKKVAHRFIFPASEAAKNADATVIVAGLDATVEGETLDRLNLVLPGHQTEMINQVATEAKGPVILAIMSGRGVEVSFAQRHTKIKAIIWAGYPGQEGGHGIADVVFGQHNPSGRLPLTWYKKEYVDQIPIYPFAYGLSYTTFKHTVAAPKNQRLDIELGKLQHCRVLNYSDGAPVPSCAGVLIDDLDHHFCSKIMISFDVEVINSGNISATESVLIFWVPPQSLVDAPIKQLVAFEKVFVPAGKSTNVRFNLNVCDSFGIVDYRGYRVLPSGSHAVVVGDGDASFPLNFNLKNFVQRF